MSTYIRRMVNLQQSDYHTVQRVADEKGLGGKGFSAALRLIIREWERAQLLPAQHPPAQDQAPASS
jgi:hypothetical protein